MSESITIPGYRIERKLGQGGMAAVYLAIQQSFEREVALKVMSPLLNSDPSFTTRFMREARIVAHMHHASIVPVFDVGEHKPYHYLSMEYLPGGDLKQRILQGRGNTDLVDAVCRALCPALDLAHRKGFVHRDIKPENILFREDGTPVLTDFGIARAVDSGTSLTMAGMLVGTPSYMSPEQVKGQELDGRSDLYSLGIVCYEVLTGTVPFRADSTLSVALKHLSEPLPELPQQLSIYQPLLDRLTAKDRNERFATGADVLRALRTLNRQAPSDVTLLRPMPAQVRKEGPSLGDRARSAVKEQAAALKGHAASLKEHAAALSAEMRKLQTKLPAIPRIVIARRPAVDRRTAYRVLAGTAAALLVAITFRAMRTDTVEPQVAQAPIEANEEPALPATPPAESIAQTADSAGESNEPVPEPGASGEIAEPGIDAEEEARLAAARAQRQAERQREIEAKRIREAQEQVAAQRAREEQIQKLLAAAKELYAKGALALPSGASAADRYQEVLQLQPGHPDAIAGKQRIASVLVAEAEHAQSVQDADALRALIPQIAWVQPGHPELVGLQSGLHELETNPVMLSRREAARGRTEGGLPRGDGEAGWIREARRPADQRPGCRGRAGLVCVSRLPGAGPLRIQRSGQLRHGWVGRCRDHAEHAWQVRST